MKIPRWLFKSMIGSSLVAVTVAVSWCWLSWPARTLRELTASIESGRFDEANQILMPPAHWTSEIIDGEPQLIFEGIGTAPRYHYASRVWQSWCTSANVQFESRSVWDLIRGRRRFSFHGEFTTPFFIGGYAERGAVVLRCEEWAVPWY